MPLIWHPLMFYAFPPFSVLTQTIYTEDRERKSNWSVGGTQLANSSVVPSNNETTSHLASNFTTREEHSTPPLLSTGNPSSSQDPAAVDLPCVRRSLEKTGISEKASSLMLNAWRKGTQKQYKTYLKQWQLQYMYTVIPQGVIHFQLLSMKE